MFVSSIKRIEREYEYKRNEANKIFVAEKKSLYEKNPRLSEIDLKIAKLGIQAAKLSLSNNAEEKILVKNNLENEIANCKKEREKILTNLNVSLKPKYSCEKCKDTGYIKTSSGDKMCNCMKQELLNEAYNNSNMYNLQNETFDTFDFTLFSEEKSPSLYKSNLSPKENIKKIVSISNDFITNFEMDTEKNLLFTGSTGVGKTFLSSCIANEILKKGYTVLYQTAPILLDSIFDYKYNLKTPEAKALYENFFSVNLLIIDDLGTENLTAAKFAELFTILNSRLITPKTKTIISTNLSLEDLSKTYDSRILSRIIGNFNICRFFGKDLRLQTVH